MYAKKDGKYDRVNVGLEKMDETGIDGDENATHADGLGRWMDGVERE